GNAVAGLIPTAAGKGKLAEAAVEFLREAKRKGLGHFLAEQLKQAAPDVAAKVRAAGLGHQEKGYPPLDPKTTPQPPLRALGQGPPPRRSARGGGPRPAGRRCGPASAAGTNSRPPRSCTPSAAPRWAPPSRCWTPSAPTPTAGRSTRSPGSCSSAGWRRGRRR